MSHDLPPGTDESELPLHAGVAPAEWTPASVGLGVAMAAVMAVVVSYVAIHGELLIAATLPISAWTLWIVTARPRASASGPDRVDDRVGRRGCGARDRALRPSCRHRRADARAGPPRAAAIAVATSALTRRALTRMEPGELSFPEGRARADLLATPGETTERWRWVSLGMLTGAAGHLAAAFVAMGPDRLLPSVGMIGVGFLMGARAAAWVAVSGWIWFGVVALADVSASAGETARHGVVAGAALGVVVAALPALWLGVTRKRPQRVRFEIGGEGTRVEDMTPRAEHDIPRGPASFLLVVATGALFAVMTWVDAATAIALAIVVVPVAVRAAELCGSGAMPVILAAALFGWRGVPLPGGVWLVVVAAASMAAALAHDLYAGRRLRATPARQQWGALLGASVGVLAVHLVGDADIGPSWLRSGIPWWEPLGYAGWCGPIAAAAAFVVELAGGPGLLLAIGLLLPLAITPWLLGGGLLRFVIRRADRGVALAVGLIGGDALFVFARSFEGVDRSVPLFLAGRPRAAIAMSALVCLLILLAFARMTRDKTR